MQPSSPDQTLVSQPRLLLVPEPSRTQFSSLLRHKQGGAEAQVPRVPSVRLALVPDCLRRPAPSAPGGPGRGWLPSSFASFRLMLTRTPHLSHLRPAVQTRSASRNTCAPMRATLRPSAWAPSSAAASFLFHLSLLILPATAKGSPSTSDPDAASRPARFSAGKWSRWRPACTAARPE